MGYLIVLLRWFKYSFITRWERRQVIFFPKKSDGYIHPATIKKIESWQQRERAVLGAKIKQGGIIKMSLVKKIHKQTIKDIKYVKDIDNYNAKEYWATTQEILQRMSGDCEDQAFVILRRLRKAQFPDDCLAAVFMKGHIFAAIHEENDFWILDNGYLTKKVIRAGSFFPSEKGDLICGFNLFDKWGY